MSYLADLLKKLKQEARDVSDDFRVGTNIAKRSFNQKQRPIVKKSINTIKSVGNFFDRYSPTGAINRNIVKPFVIQPFARGVGNVVNSVRGKGFTPTSKISKEVFGDNKVGMIGERYKYNKDVLEQNKYVPIKNKKLSSTLATGLTGLALIGDIIPIAPETKALKLLKLSKLSKVNKVGDVVKVLGKDAVKYGDDILRAIAKEKDVNKISKLVKNAENAGSKTRGFVKTIQDSPVAGDKLKKGVKGTYDPIANIETLGKAEKNIAKNFEDAVYRAKTQDNITTEIQAESLKLIDKLQEMGRHQDAIDVAEKTSARATEGGQASQILATFNNLTPENILIYAQREVDKAKKTLPQFKNVEITPKISSKIKKMAEYAQGLTGEAKQDATRLMLEEINRIVPTPWSSKLTTLLKAGWLTGIKGAVGGNTLGNSAMAVVKKLSDVPASGIDSAISKIFKTPRGKAFTLKKLMGGFGEGLGVGYKNLRKGIGSEDLASKLDYKKAFFGNSKTGKMAQKYTDFVFNFYSSADKPFYYSALRNTLDDLAKVEGINKGLKGKELTSYVNKITKEPPAELLAKAVDEAKTLVFQNKNAIGSALSGFKKGLRTHGGATGEIVSEVTLPFTGVPSSITTAVHNYSPTGAVAGMVDAFGKVRNGTFDQLAQRKLSEALGKGITGTGLIWLGSHLTKTGQMTLGYPKDAGERTLWEQEGKTPYSIQIGGRWHSLNYLGPIMSLLAIGGEVDKARDDGSGGIGAYAKGALGSGKAILSSSPLQGMQAGLNAITDPQRYGDSYVNNLAAGIVPTLPKDIAVAGDPLQRERNTAGEAIQSKIPYFRNQLLAKRGFFGNELPRKTTAIGSVINPLRSSKIKTSPVISELRRLQDAGFGPTMSKLSKNQTINGEKTKLTPQELDKLEKVGGNKIKKTLDVVIGDSIYSGLSDENKQKLINKIVNNSRKEAKTGEADTKDYLFEIDKMQFEQSGDNIGISRDGSTVFKRGKSGRISTVDSAKFEKSFNKKKTSRRAKKPKTYSTSGITSTPTLNVSMPKASIPKLVINSPISTTRFTNVPTYRKHRGRVRFARTRL